MGGKFEPVIRNNGQVWRLLTSIILHAGILHILSNVFIQLRFGYTLELRWGWPKFVMIYILTGISASLWSSVLSYESVSVGASGALFGLVGADLAYVIYNWKEIPHVQQEACFIAMITVLTFLFGIDSQVDNFAHLGGLISGLCMGMWLPITLVKRPGNIENYWRYGGMILFWGFFLLFCLLLWVDDPNEAVDGFPISQFGFSSVCNK